ncbi:MAG: ABC transporter substrate-binding protein, partial [Bacilli bacterium]
DKLPIIITAVTDPVAAGLVASMDAKDDNVFGTSDLVDIDKQIDLLLKTKSDVKKVGLLYTKSESNSKIQIDLAIAYLEELGIEYVEMAATSSNDVLSTTRALMQKVDVVFIPTDNTISGAMATISELSKEYKVPVVPGSIEMAQIGGVATYGLDYKKLGKQTAQMLVKVLKDGVDYKDLGIEAPANLELYVNEEMAKSIDVDVSKLKVE